MANNHILRNDPLGDTIKFEPNDFLDEFETECNLVLWSPLAGARLDYSTVSPSLMLDHEADHAVQWLRHPKQFERDANKVTGHDKQYNTKEERRVITNREQKVARGLKEIPKNQVTRENHNGKMIRVKDPTSNIDPAAEHIKRMFIEKPIPSPKRIENIHDNTNPCIGCDGPAPSGIPPAGERHDQ